MSVSEDELTNAIIQYHRESQKEMNESGPDSYKLHTFPEAHYDHYGNRGVADLYVVTDDWSGDVYELKSESAVREVSGANAILRQFNKMREYFFSGSSHKPPRKRLHFELCFTPSAYNFRHIAENAEMYCSAVNQGLAGVGTERVFATVTMRPADPESITPVTFFGPNTNSFEMDLSDHIEHTQPEIYTEYRDVIEEIA